MSESIIIYLVCGKSETLREAFDWGSDTRREAELYVDPASPENDCVRCFEVREIKESDNG